MQLVSLPDSRIVMFSNAYAPFSQYLRSTGYTSTSAEHLHSHSHRRVDHLLKLRPSRQIRLSFEDAISARFLTDTMTTDLQT